MKRSFENRIRQLLIGVACITLIGITLSYPLQNAFAFQVPELPPGNLISNPWFRSTSIPTLSGLDGWIDAGGKNKYWSTSQKVSNPSPQILISGVCDMEPVYCGTGARLSPNPGQSGGVGVPGVDAYLYQVVSGNSSNQRLKFFAHWVSHKIDPAEVTIHGGYSPLGPWVKVWTPFYIVEETNGGPEDIWTDTGYLDTTITNGFPFYKVEIHARLPSDVGSGFKITGVYFSTDNLSGEDWPPPPPNYSYFNFLPAVVLD